MSKRNPVSDAREVLDTLWSDSGGDYDLPVDPIRIARRLNADVYVAELPSGQSGQLRVQDGSIPKIYLSKGNGPQRQRFTCAHEIGHLVDRKKRPSGAKTFVDFRDGRSSTGSHADEVYANKFAAELLMPAESVRRDFGKGIPVPKLAQRYGVSQAAMQFRLENLSLSR